MPGHILVVEDEPDIQNILKEFLEDAGYAVQTADDGLEGLSAFGNGAFDLVLLDIMLPKIDGYTVLEMVRKSSDTPVIMLTAKDEESDQLRGFELKADDYITKPFSISLVIKRVEAVLRRTRTGSAGKVLKHRELTLDIEAYSACVSGKPVALTSRELEILRILIENKGRVITREQLLNKVWAYDFYGDEKIVNTHIKNIRKKLGVDYIETIRGVGYRVDKAH